MYPEIPWRKRWKNYAGNEQSFNLNVCKDVRHKNKIKDKYDVLCLIVDSN